jgi:Fusaric acid resistance protein-like
MTRNQNGGASVRIARLVRAGRAAIVAPSLFALALLIIKQPDVAGFAVFGTFVHLVMIEYDSSRRARFAEAAMLTLLGATAIGLATLASADVWLAIAGALAAGFLSECPWLARGHLARIRTALLLAFMLGVASTASGSAVYPRLAGWLLAGLVAQPILLLLWVPIQPIKTASEIGARRNGEARSTGLDSALSWIGNAAATGAAMGFAVLITRVLKLDHAFWVFLGVLPIICARGTSPTRTFWEQQVGTLVGCLIGASLVAIIGTHSPWYWPILPLTVFVSVYASSAFGFMTGQAAFTVFVVVLFCILQPHQGNVGVLRVKDIAIGGAVSLVAVLLRRLADISLR